MIAGREVRGFKRTVLVVVQVYRSTPSSIVGDVSVCSAVFLVSKRYFVVAPTVFVSFRV